MRPTGFRAGPGSIALRAGCTDRGMRKLRHTRTTHRGTRVARWLAVGAAGMLVATAAAASPQRRVRGPGGLLGAGHVSVVARAVLAVFVVVAGTAAAAP